MSDNPDNSLYLRVKEAFGEASDANIAERLKVSRSAVSQWKQGTTKPDAHKLIRVEEITGVPLGWLLTGDINHLRIGIDKMPESANHPNRINALRVLHKLEAAGLLARKDEAAQDEQGVGKIKSITDSVRSELEPIDKAAEATDAEIIEQFEMEELRAIRELAAQGRFSIPTAIHILTREDLESRGLIRNPIELKVESLSTSSNPLCFIEVLGEITEANALYLYPQPQRAQVPLHFNPTKDKDVRLHPNFFHAYRISTNELTEEGLHQDDLILCSVAFFFTDIKDGQPVLIPLDSKSKALFRRFYRDPFNTSRFLFRPLKGNRPIIKLPNINFADLEVVLGIVTP